MKTLTRLGAVLLLSAGLSSQANAQDMAMELEMACVGDVELSNAVIKVIQGESVSDGQLTEHEVSQVQTLLTEDSVSSLDTPDQFKAVMAACVEGRIFQERHAEFLGAQ